MKRIVPEYYKEFKCIGSNCKHNCCIGWGIDIDEESCDAYMNTDGKIGKKLHEKIYKDEDGCYTFKMNGDRCPFLNAQNLCEIFIELGENKLCRVCTEYPRYAEQFGEFEEKGIGLSCEEAGRIIFGNTEPVKFTCEEFDEEYETLDAEEQKLYDIIISSRTRIYEILQNRNYSVNSRVSSMIDYAKEVQNRINNNSMEISDIPVQTEEKIHGGNKENTIEIISFFKEIVTRTNEWKEKLDEIEKRIYTNNDTHYYEIYEQTISTVDERGYEKFLMYFIHRYYLKAMYDYDVFAKVRLAAAAYIMLRESDMLTVFKNGKFTFEDRIENARLFSAELEHSQENIDALYDELLFNEAFSGESLKLSL